MNELTNQHVLIITTSGGGAHLTTAEALKEGLSAGKISLATPQSIKSVDILKEWVGTPGIFGTHMWNLYMKQGNTKKLQNLMVLQRYSDYLFALPVFLHLIFYLLKHPIDTIYDCQPLTTRTILRALWVMEKVFKRHIDIVKVITEPSHAYLDQYLVPIAKLPKYLKKRLYIWGSEPLRQHPDERAKDFWKNISGIEAHQLLNQGTFPVRLAFIENKRFADYKQLTFKANHIAEVKWLKKYFNLSINSTIANNGIESFQIQLPFQALVFTIMLGSQGTEDATVNYVEQIIEHFDSEQIYLFVYTGKIDFQEGIRPRLKQLIDNKPTRTNVCPFSYQPALNLAPLMARSNITITRSGGATSMELLTLNQGHCLIHSNNHGEEDETKRLLKHEYGNYLYLKEYHSNGAKLIDKHSLIETLQDIIVM